MAQDNIDHLVNNRYLLSEINNKDLFAKAYEFNKILELLKKEKSYPYFQPLECNLGPEAIIQGKKVIMLGSNNYLGLTTHPKVREAAVDAIQKYGTSMTGSRLLNGTLELHETFEHEIAEFLGKEAALVFTTGYQVNLGIISALTNPNTMVFLDEFDHASLFDAVKLSGAKLRLFKHNNPSDLERLLQRAPENEAKLVAIDGVFSMEGDIIALKEIVDLCKKFGARLVVDDAHSVGVLGEKGQGTAAHFGLTDQVDLIMGTFSKSLASTGGYVAGDAVVIDYIKHFGRSMLFSASITPPNLAAAREALKILQQEPERITQVMNNAKRLKTELSAMGWQVGPTQTPIIPIHIGNDFTTLLLWKDLLEAGVYVNPVIYPAVEKDKAVLRVSTIATHTPEHLTQALEAFQVVGERYNVLQKNTIHAVL